MIKTTLLLIGVSFFGFMIPEIITAFSPTRVIFPSSWTNILSAIASVFITYYFIG